MRECHRSLCQLDRNCDSTVTAGEESRLACLHMRRGLTPLWNSKGTPRSMSALERDPEVVVSSPGDDIGPAPNGEVSQEAARNSHADCTFLRPHQRLPDVPIVTREELQVSCRNLKKTRRFSLQHKMRLFSTVASREISHLPFCVSKGSLTPLRQLKKFNDIPLCTREEHQGSRLNSKRAPVFPPHL